MRTGLSECQRKVRLEITEVNWKEVKCMHLHVRRVRLVRRMMRVICNLVSPSCTITWIAPTLRRYNRDASG